MPIDFSIAELVDLAHYLGEKRGELLNPKIMLTFKNRHSREGRLNIILDKIIKEFGRINKEMNEYLDKPAICISPLNTVVNKEDKCECGKLLSLGQISPNPKLCVNCYLKQYKSGK